MMNRNGRLVRLTAACGLALTGMVMAACAQDAAEKSGELFRTLDADGDGKVEAGEVPQVRQRFFDRLVRVGDADEDGALSRSEFDNATAGDVDLPTQSQAGMDRPADRGSRQSLTDRDPAGMFRRFDRNSDGKLSLEEIPEFARNRMRPFFVQLGKREITIEDLSRVRSAPNDRRPMQRPETGRRPADSDRRPGDRPLPEIRSGAAQRSGAMQRSAGGQPLMNGQSLAFFRELDQNRDGTLSRQELNRAATLLAKFDQNGDDQLEVSELFGLRGPRNSRSGSGPLRPGRRDATDRSGTSDRPGAEQTQRSKTQRSETSRPPASGGNRPDVEQSFKRLDSNSDGFLNRAEVSGKMKEHFVRIDRNADGKVSLEELQATVDRFSRR